MNISTAFTIREILPKDNAALAEIIRYNLKNHGLDIPGTVYFDPEVDNLYAAYSGKENRGYFVLVDADDRVVGGIGFDEFAHIEGCAELQKLYLADSVTGAGLGYTLIEFIENTLRAKGFCRSYLETHHNLKAAMHIYEKSGYSEIARPNDVVHGAMDHFFCKKL